MVSEARSLLTTRPIAPSSPLCAQTYTTERAKRGSIICGIATRSCPVSDFIAASTAGPARALQHPLQDKPATAVAKKKEEKNSQPYAPAVLAFAIEGLPF